MRVVFLATQDLESPSMIGRWWPLARELARLGHQITISTLHSNFSKQHNNNFSQDNVNVQYVAPMHVRKEGNKKSYYPSHRLIQLSIHATWRQVGTLLSSPADVVHICKPHPMNSIAGVIGRQFRTYKIFLDCDDYEAASGNFSHKWQQRIIGWFEKQMPFRVQLVTANTFFMRDKMISWGVPENKIVYLSNGVDRERFSMQDPQKVEDLRQEFDLDNKRVVAYIGTIGLASHAVDMLIDAFAIVLNNIPNSVLMMVGGGEDFQLMQAYGQSLGLARSIRWIGKVPPELVPLYYQLANVTVDPVRDDDAARGRAPLKLFESWACGIPFISANVGDRSWLAGDPPAALLVPPGSVQALAEAIMRLLDSPQKTASLSARGLERVKDFTWDKLASRIEGLYRDLLERRSDRLVRERKS